MGEKCSQTMSDKGLLHKIYKEFIQQQQAKTKTKKNG